MAASIVPDQKLRIAMVCDSVTDYIGGCMLKTLRFAELLSANGHQIIFITGRSRENRNDGKHGSCEVLRFRSITAPFFEGRFFLALPTKQEIVKALRAHHIDIVHVLLPLPCGIAAIAAARELGLPVVMHSAMQPENFLLNVPRILPTAALNRLFYRYAHWFYGQANTMIFPTEFSRRLFTSLPPHVNTRVITNGVNTEVFKKVDTSRFFQKFDVPLGTRNLLFVGRLHPEKDVVSLVRAMPFVLREHPQTRLFIVGHGHQEAGLKRMARDLGVDDQVTFFGPLTGDDLVQAYNACDIFVLPSVAESQGIVVLEAMACGKPLLVANSPDSAAVHMLDGNGRLFEPRDPEDLAAKANELLADPGLLSALGERSLEVSKRHDIKDSVAALEDVYWSLLMAQPSPTWSDHVAADEAILTAANTARS